jgi:hypothetical protein
MRHNHKFERQPLTITLGHEDYSIGAGGGGEDRGDDFQPTGADAAAQAAADKIAADQAAADKAAADKAAADAAKAGEGKTADELAEEAEEETAEEKAAREAEEAAAAAKKRTRIPLDRHEKIVEAARTREAQLVARIQELEKGKEPAQQRKDVLAEMRTQISELQDKYEAHVFAGEKDEAKAVRKELDTLRETYTDQKVAASSSATRAQTIDALKYEAALAKVEGDYPELNPDNKEAFNDAKADEVAEMMAMFVNSGLTRQAALEKSVRYVMGSPAAKKDAGKDAAAETLRAAREKAAREKAAAADKQQPPDTSKAGADNDKAGARDSTIDVMKLDQEKFAKLDEDTLAKLRGDVLA